MPHSPSGPGRATHIAPGFAQQYDCARNSSMGGRRLVRLMHPGFEGHPRDCLRFNHATILRTAECSALHVMTYKLRYPANDPGHLWERRPASLAPGRPTGAVGRPHNLIALYHAL